MPEIIESSLLSHLNYGIFPESNDEILASIKSYLESVEIDCSSANVQKLLSAIKAELQQIKIPMNSNLKKIKAPMNTIIETLVNNNITIQHCLQNTQCFIGGTFFMTDEIKLIENIFQKIDPTIKIDKKAIIAAFDQQKATRSELHNFFVRNQNYPTARTIITDTFDNMDDALIAYRRMLQDVVTKLYRQHSPPTPALSRNNIIMAIINRNIRKYLPEYSQNLGKVMTKYVDKYVARPFCNAGTRILQRAVPLLNIGAVTIDAAIWAKYINEEGNHYIRNNLASLTMILQAVSSYISVEEASAGPVTAVVLTPVLFTPQILFGCAASITGVLRDCIPNDWF
ncbi:MAG: hypothetical protein JW841_09120 [Deltaproteobacteria bacterium]|nr:hypothetical protein [Deltaproteobacteria bacterium]